MYRLDLNSLTKIILCVVSRIPLYVALVYINATITSSMRGSRKFFQRGSKFDYVFLVDREIEDPNTAINGPTSARQLAGR